MPGTLNQHKLLKAWVKLARAVSPSYHGARAWLDGPIRQNRRLLYFVALALVVVGLADLVGPRPPEARPLPTPPAPVELNEGLMRRYAQEPTVTIFYHHNGSRGSLPLERYIERVVAAETVPGWEHATLAAQAIVARTFTLRSMESPSNTPRVLHGTDVCTSKDHFQAYSARRVDGAIRRAVAETRGLVLTFQGGLALAHYSASSGGMTAALEEGFPAVELASPYLVPRPSPDQEIAPGYAGGWTARVSRATLERTVGARPGDAHTVVIESRGRSGRAKLVRVGRTTIHASELRRRLGPELIRSTLITGISVGRVRVTFQGRGWGHGVGLDQWGAEAMARQGRSYKEILAHYFPGTSIVRLWE
jgi:stage II sporulation protein D